MRWIFRESASWVFLGCTILVSFFLHLFHFGLLSYCFGFTCCCLGEQRHREQRRELRSDPHFIPWGSRSKDRRSFIA